MRMDKDNKPLNTVDKGVFLLLLIAAAAGALLAMVAGPLGKEDLSIAAALGASIIACALLAHTLSAFKDQRRK